MAPTAADVSWDDAAPVCGDGNDFTIIRRAVLGTEVSIDVEDVKSARRSRRGDRPLIGSRNAKGPILKSCQMSFLSIGDRACEPVPFQRLILHLSILVVQRRQQGVRQLCGGCGIMGEEGRARTGQDAEQIIQRHVPDIWIRVADFDQQRVDSVI